MAKRTRKHQTTAGELAIGDVIATDPGHVFKATVTRVAPHRRFEGVLCVDMAYPNDFTVNASFRGQHTGRTWMADEPVTRYHEA